MQPQAPDSPAPLLGREERLNGLQAFFGTSPGPRAMVFVGQAGIGKTTLWRAGISIAHDRGLRVLSARASEAESTLSFATIADLLDGTDLGLLPGLPGPQRTALEVALRRVEPESAPPEPFAIQAGLLSAIRNMAASKPVLVAVDDVTLADAPSATALAYAVRRLHAEPVRFLFTRRARRLSEVERAFDPETLQSLEVGPLSFGAISHLITDRLTRSLPRRVLRQIYETSRGNPLFAYEIGRALVERGLPEIGDDLPVPHVLEDLFRAELANLPPEVRRAVLAIALSGELTRSELAAVVDATAVDEAIDAGLLTGDASRVAASHPLLAAAARRHSSAGERRRLHRELAAVATDPTLKARHLARAALGADAEVAATVAMAADLACRRGGIQDAVDLATHALRLTPPGASERVDRILALARFLQTAGAAAQVRKLFAAHLDSLPHGAARAAAHLILAESAEGGTLTFHLEHAVKESADDPALRAFAQIRLSVLQSIGLIAGIADAERLANEAVEGVGAVDPEIGRLGLAALAWARILRGRRIDDLVERMPTSPLASSMLMSSVARPAAVQLAFRGEIARAQAMLSGEVTQADERGEARSAMALHAQLCELALRAGDATEASRLLEEWDQWAATIDPEVPLMRTRLQALLAAIRGESVQGKKLAAQVLETTRANARHRWDLLESDRAYGIACLFEHDAKNALGSLKSVWDYTVREGVDDPGAFPVAPDLVEALVEAGQAAAASEVTQRLHRLAAEQAHPWGTASAKRCMALLQLEDGYDVESAAALAGAAEDYRLLGLKFDQARTMLFLGKLLRRFKKRAEARRALEAAAGVFEESGADGWADQARSELARVSGRRSADAAELTASEQRVASLAARGLSNKEIAKRLFVTVYTVETHLSHAYAKLGIRSRAQLVHRLVNAP